MKSPYVIYADFESIINKFKGPTQTPDKSSTHKNQIHEACGFCYIAVRGCFTIRVHFR